MAESPLTSFQASVALHIADEALKAQGGEGSEHYATAGAYAHALYIELAAEGRPAVFSSAVPENRHLSGATNLSDYQFFRNAAVVEDFIRWTNSLPQPAPRAQENVESMPAKKQAKKSAKKKSGKKKSSKKKSAKKSPPKKKSPKKKR